MNSSNVGLLPIIQSGVTLTPILVRQCSSGSLPDTELARRVFVPRRLKESHAHQDQLNLNCLLADIERLIDRIAEESLAITRDRGAELSPLETLSGLESAGEFVMDVWGIFRRNSPPAQKVTTGRFEIERDGEIAYLEYTLSGNILGLIHTEVPERLRHMGLASSLAETALHLARQHNLKANIICPQVREYVPKHSEYSHLVMH